MGIHLALEPFLFLLILLFPTHNCNFAWVSHDRCSQSNWVLYIYVCTVVDKDIRLGQTEKMKKAKKRQELPNILGI